MRVVTATAMPGSPAEQLGSVAARYRGVTSCRLVIGRRRHAWWELQRAADRGVLPVEDPLARRERVEAILLLAREPLNSRRLAAHARLADGTEARTVVRALNRLYDSAGRAFRVEEVAGGFRLLTRRQFAPWLRRLEHIPPQERLSAPAMETLAVVAYRQPVLRAEIEAVRGVSCGEILRQLMERDLVRIGGRSDELGRPYLYTTTKRFLQLFGLQNLDQLPRAEALRGAARSQTEVRGLPVPSASSGDQHEEEEKSEVRATSPMQKRVNEVLDDDALLNALSPALVDDESGDVDELDDEEDEFDDFEDDDDDDDEEDEEDDEKLEEEEEDFDEDEWEEVEGDEEELDDDWDDEDDDDWDDDDDDDDLGDDEDKDEDKEEDKEEDKDEDKDEDKEEDKEEEEEEEENDAWS